MTKLSYKTLFTILFLLLAFIVLLLRLQYHPNPASAGWFDDSWSYRKAVNITNSVGTTLTDFQVSLSIGTSALIASGKMQSDCDDIRITDQLGNLLDHWLEPNTCNTSANSATVWVKIPNIPSSNGTVYLYYGNPSATSISSTTKTFIREISGVVGAWNMDENVGTSIADTSGYSNTGTFGAGDSAPAWTTGKYSIGTSFDGSNDYIQISNLSVDTSTTNAKTTVSFWLYWTGTSSQMPFSWNVNYYDLYFSSSDCFGYNTGGGDCWGISKTGLSNQWVYVTAIFNNGSVQSSSLYINGNSQSLSQISGSPATKSIGNGVKISGWTATGQYLGGKIDELQIYNRALSSAEITDLYTNYGYTTTNYSGKVLVKKVAATSPTSSLAAEETGGGPVAHWSFNEGVGTNTYDSSGHSNTAVFSGSTLPQWQTEDKCISGKCLSFNGEQGSVALTNGGNIPWSNPPFSISLWFYANNYLSGTAPELFKGSITEGWISLRVAYNNELEFQVKGGSGTVEINSPNNYISQNKWYHATAVYNPSGTTIMYINGQQIGTTSTASAGTLTKSGNTTIGVAFNSWEWKGKIDEVKIFPYARTAAQIKQDYAAGKAKAAAAEGGNVNLGAPKGAQSGLASSFSEGLVGYWNFDNGAGSTAADLSGNGNTATLGTGSSAPGWMAGNYGIGLSFDGNDYVSVTNNSLNPGTGDISVVAWLKPSALANDQTGIVRYETGNTYYILEHKNDSTLLVEFRDGTCSSQSLVTTDTINLNTWAHIALTIDRDSIAKIFINGNLSKSTTTFTNCQASMTGGVVNFGRHANYLNGLIDEVRIYNRALSPLEVRQLYEWAPGPVAYYNFEEGIGTSALDSSGNSYNGSLTGATWVTGKFGGGIKTANSQYISTGFNWNNLSNATVEAWVNFDSSGIGSSYSGIFGGVSSESNTLFLYNNLLYWRVNSTQFSKSFTVSANTWYHLVATKIGATGELFINGISYGTGTIGSVFASSNLAISTINTGSSTYSHKGQIDDVRIYNYARTQKQIIEDMNAGHPAISATGKNTIAYYDFDEGFGSTANNSGSVGSTLNGTLGTGNSSPTWTTNGKFGKALSFDGSNDYVSVSSTINPIQSISFWANIGATSTSILNLGTSISVSISNSQIIATGFTSPTIYVNAIGTTAITPNTWQYISINTNTGFTGTSINFGKIGSNFYTGLLDEVKIYNYALTEDEVKLDYNRGSSVQMGSLSSGSGNTAPATAASQEYCVPGDASTCSPPVARWDFNEGTGTTAYDTSGNSNYSVFGNGNSSPTWTTGKYGKGLNFNGSSQYTSSVGPTFPSNNNVPFTLQAWIKTSDNSRTAILQSITSNDNDNWLGIGTSGSVARFYTYDASAKHLLGTGTINNNQWHFITATFDTSNGKKLYVDGKLEATDVGTTNIGGTTNHFHLGSSAYLGVLSAFFNGLIDQVRIYNYARTPAQIAWDYNQGAPVAHWKFDECQGDVAHSSADPATAGLNGSISIGASGTQVSLGTCAVGDTSAWSNGSTGKINSSLNFDGTDDYISISDSTSLSPTSAITISAWIKGSTQQNKQIVTHFDYGNNQRAWSLATGDSSTSKFKVRISDDGTWDSGHRKDYESSIIALDNNWHHVVLAFNAGTATIYVNGVSDSNPNKIYDDAITTIKDSSATINIGSYLNNGSAAGFFSGQIDDVKIFNYALTATQVKTLYNNGAVNFN